ncbi:MAG: hypothetical protein ACREP7_19460 [Lysobacter sp.]
MIAALLTVPVVLYQLLFVLIMYIASKFGIKTMIAAMIVCLAWTLTHLFFPPLAVLQSAVIIGSFFWFRPKRQPAQSVESQQ